jgi:hypothetical protein
LFARQPWDEFGKRCIQSCNTIREADLMVQETIYHSLCVALVNVHSGRSLPKERSPSTAEEPNTHSEHCGAYIFSGWRSDTAQLIGGRFGSLHPRLTLTIHAPVALANAPRYSLGIIGVFVK